MIRDADVGRVVERILAFHDPDVIYAFGSYAKGKLHEDSDLDLVVVERSALPRALRGRDVQGVLAEMPFDIDLLFITPEELERDVHDPWTLLGTVMPNAPVIHRRAATEA